MPCSPVEVHSLFGGKSRSFLGLLFHTECGGSTFLRNVGKLLSDFTVSLPRRTHSKVTALRISDPIYFIKYEFHFLYSLSLGSRKPRSTAVGIRYADHATPSTRKVWH
jgi:hypothetical protein